MSVLWVPSEEFLDSEVVFVEGVTRGFAGPYETEKSGSCWIGFVKESDKIKARLFDNFQSAKEWVERCLVVSVN
jgi:hypothetical protein